eukprot:scaffold10550_cov119-Skeletonema_menzelii.AAC.1
MHLFQSLVVVALAASSNVAATSDPHLHLRSSSDESNNIVKSEERKLNRNREPKGLFKGKGGSYEVWGSDQSNSVAGETSAGVHGSFLWIWDSDDIQDQLNGGADAKPLSCTPSAAEGPCDLLDIFPGVGSGAKVEDLDAFGRLHGVLPDPFNLYVTANIFAPTGGYVGVIDTATKEAIALFRVTETDAIADVGRSVHMSFFTADGSAIIIDNLHGKMIERINVTRDKKGKITDLVFDTNAGVYLGKDFTKEADATAFKGDNAFGNSLIGSVAGDYSLADTGDDTPAGKRKEWDCSEVIDEDKKILGGCRPNNVPICPVTSSNNLAYVTLGGGGLFVLKLDETPMRIVGEYGNRIISGAGCGGAEAQGRMFLNGGTSASPAGATQSTFSVYAIDDSGFDTTTNKENFPFPSQIFNDATNTNTIGNLDGTSTTNESGQLPNLTTRRDSHGAAATLDGKYVHVVDRIQNVVEVFDAITGERANTYDLVSSDGKSGREGPAGPCLMRSVLDDKDLHLNDPAPDLMTLTPDGKHLMIAFRGPKPVTVGHAAQGSCPGVGIVELSKDGKSGKLVDVLRASNTVDTVPVETIPGGTNYAGVERSDVHGAIVVTKKKN